MLKIRENEKVYKTWLILNTAVVFGLFLYFSLYKFAPNYFGRLYYVGYVVLPLIFVPCYLLFKGIKDSIELKLYFFFCLILTVSKILDIALLNEIDLIITLGCWMGLCYLGEALLLPEDIRFKLLDLVCIIVSVFYSVLGIVAIYAVINGETLMHPLTGAPMCEMVSGRLFLFNANCNGVASWYYIIFCLQLYLVFRYRKVWQKLLLALSAVISYIVITLTFSRSAMVAFSLCIGMLAVVLCLKYIQLKKLWQRIAAIVLLVSIFSLLAYKSFDVSSSKLAGLETGSNEQIETEQILPEEAKSPAENKQSSYAENLNNRGFSSSGRVTLWIAALQSLQEEPMRILTGSSNARDYTNEYVKQHYTSDYTKYGFRNHHHNNYLEIFLEVGIIGFVIYMAFLALLVIKMIKLYFSPAVTVAVKILVIMVSGMLVHNCFESTLFYVYDLRTVIFCVIAGYILAAEKALSKKFV